MGDIGSDYADDRARRREERRQRRAQEKAQEESRYTQEETVVDVTPTRSSRKSGPEIEVSLKKTPAKMSREQSEDKQEINEAEQKAEEIRLKREREQAERYREKMEELRLTREKGEQELVEIEERKERRRLKQEAEERRLQQEQEEREAREAEDAKRLREDIQKRRQEAEERRRNIQNSLSYVRPNYSTTENILHAEKEKAMSPEERAEHKKRYLEERVPPLRISSASVEKLRELALNLQAKLVELYGASFDLMKRKQRQEYDSNELEARIADLSKVATPKKPIVLTVDTGHVSKIKEKGFFVEEKPVRKSFLQERNEGIAASGGVQGRLNMFQNKTDLGDDQPDIKRASRSTWKAPEYDKCNVCNKNVYTLERLEVAKKLYHKQCFKCEYCKKVTSVSNYALFEGKVYCKPHQRKVERESLQQGIGTRH